MADDFRVDDLIGARFVTHGRSREKGFDCYGLAIEASRRLGHELPDLWYRKSDSETFAVNAGAIMKEMSGLVRETDEWRLGNLILFSDEGGRMVHIGVVVKEGVFLHCDFMGVRITDVDGFYRKKWKVYGWLR